MKQQKSKFLAVNMKSSKLTLIFSLLCLATTQTNAAVISVPDQLNATGDVDVIYTIDSLTSGVNADISGESSVYMIGTFFFETIVGNQFYLFQADSRAGGGDNIVLIDKNFANDFSLSRPGSHTAPSKVVDGTTITFALKIDQTSGNFEYFLNPNFADTEANNTAATSGSGASTAAIASVGYRWGNGTESTADLTDFALYTGTDSPFAPIPEPSAALLGGIGALLLLRRRR